MIESGTDPEGTIGGHHSSVGLILMRSIGFILVVLGVVCGTIAFMNRAYESSLTCLLISAGGIFLAMESGNDHQASM